MSNRNNYLSNIICNFYYRYYKLLKVRLLIYHPNYWKLILPQTAGSILLTLCFQTRCGSTFLKIFVCFLSQQLKFRYFLFLRKKKYFLNINKTDVEKARIIFNLNINRRQRWRPSNHYHKKVVKVISHRFERMAWTLGHLDLSWEKTWKRAMLLQHCYNYKICLLLFIGVTS